MNQIFYPGDLLKTVAALCYSYHNNDFVFDSELKTLDELNAAQKLFYFKGTRIFVIISCIPQKDNVLDYSCVFLLTPDAKLCWSYELYFEKV
jgi:hypothetical protein